MTKALLIDKQALLDALCRRCINYEMCQGTGCAPIKDVAMLYDIAEGKNHEEG